MLVSTLTSCPLLAMKADDSKGGMLQVDYRQPYCRGTSDPFQTALEGTAFNNRKQSGVFVAGVQALTCIS